MTVETDDSRRQYATNGTTGPWTVPFYFLADDELAVTYTNSAGVDTVLALDVDYAVVGAGDEDGGTVTTTIAYAAGGFITIERDVEFVQETVYPETGPFPAKSHERALDRLTMMCQQVRDEVAQTIKFPASYSGDTSLGDAATRANKLIGFDSAGNLVYAGPVSGSATDLALQLASATGSSLVGRLYSLVYPPSTVGAALTGMVNAAELPGVDRSGLVDSSAAISAVIAAGIKRIYFPAGTYLLSNVTLLSNLEIYGDGDATILRPLTNTTAYVFNADSGSSVPANNITNVYIHDLMIRGWSDTAGLNQFFHLVTINGVTNFKFERVTFMAARGDHLYIGSGNTGGQERHNFGVTVRKCTFDGVNHTNRNGISVIDCVGLLVDDSLFQNLSDPTMPGAIDVEPNAAWNVCRDIKITHNRFYANGGTAGWFALQAGNIGSTTPPSGFLVSDNTVDSAGYVSDIERGLFISLFGNASSASYPLDFKFSDNTLRNTRNVIRMDGVSDVVFKDNRWLGTTAEAQIGFTYRCINIDIEDNLFYQVANDNTLGGKGVTVFNASYLGIRRNRFVNCGKADGTSGLALQFNVGSSDNISIEQNTATGVNTTTAIAVQGTHTLTPSTNIMRQNAFGTLGVSTFQAANGTATYNPPSLASGASTSTTVSAPGARLGRPAYCAFSLDQAVVNFTAYVSAADVVTVVLTNTSAGVVDLGSGTLSVWAPPT